MSRGEVVKSAYMLDPSDGVSLIRRDESGPNIDKEYWQRVNQVENIFYEFIRHSFGLPQQP